MDKREKHRLYMLGYYKKRRADKRLCKGCNKIKAIYVLSKQLCRWCQTRKSQRIWKKKNRYKLNIQLEKWRNRTGKSSNYYFLEKMYSGNREKVIQRDGEKCIMCGFSREEHKKKWGKDLAVDHIRGKGKYDIHGGRRNGMNNLQTLCFMCHGRKSSTKNYEILT